MSIRNVEQLPNTEPSKEPEELADGEKMAQDERNEEMQLDNLVAKTVAQATINQDDVQLTSDNEAELPPITTTVAVSPVQLVSDICVYDLYFHNC